MCIEKMIATAKLSNPEETSKALQKIEACPRSSLINYCSVPMCSTKVHRLLSLLWFTHSDHSVGISDQVEHDHRDDQEVRDYTDGSFRRLMTTLKEPVQIFAEANFDYFQSSISVLSLAAVSYLRRNSIWGNLAKGNLTFNASEVDCCNGAGVVEILAATHQEFFLG
ncbi:hypothetical protein QYF36_018554 [Acer negundo]|nr:hypothetical protein QYF36_018554 [Acer negundo]